MKTKVLTISGVTAGGKTTLIQALAETYPQAKILSFDDYSIDALPSAPSFDYFKEEPLLAIQQYDLDLLMADFAKLYEKVPFLLIDFPFGKCHQSLSPWIDWAVYLKTPFDVAFARQIQRDFRDEADSQVILDWCQTYDSFVHPLVVLHEAIVCPSVDQVIDGQIPLAKKIEELQDFFNTHDRKQ